MTENQIVELKKEAKYSIIKFFEFVDVSTIEKARPIIKEQLPKDTSIIAIDLSDTEFLDSHGIGFFVSILKKAHAKEGRLFFCGARNQPAAVLKMVGFNETLVTYCENVDEVEKHL